jgi:hypothetical protein
LSLLDVIVSVLVSGSIFGSIGFAVGLGLRPGLLLRVENYAHVLVKTEIDNFIQNLNENPKFVQELLNPFIATLSKEFGMEKEGRSSGDLKIGGFKIPNWLVQAGLGLMQQGKRQSALPPGLEELIPR